MLFAQITDLHVCLPGTLLAGRSDTAGFLDSAVARLNGLRPRPQFVLVTGDLVEGGSKAEYRHLRERLAPLQMPAFLRARQSRWPRGVPGELRGPRILGSRPVLRAIRGRTRRPAAAGARHPCPGKPSGALCAERLGWLTERLAEDRETPTVVAMHHPPIAVGMPLMDPSCLLDGAGRFRELIAAAPNVERIPAGHLHRPVTVRYAGTVLDVMPGVAHQVSYDPEGGAPLCLVFEPRMLQLHRLIPGAGLVSHKLYVDAFDGPYPFGGG